MPIRFVFAFLLLAGACSIEERGAPGTNPDTRVDLSSGEDSVTLTLSAPDTARRGDAVPVAITVRNATARTLELALAGREIAFDIIVTHNGSVVWQRLAGKSMQSILQLKKLQPNESFELIDRWPAEVPAGRYEIAAKILTDAQPLTPDSIAITIE